MCCKLIAVPLGAGAERQVMGARAHTGLWHAQGGWGRASHRWGLERCGGGGGGEAWATIGSLATLRAFATTVAPAFATKVAPALAPALARIGGRGGYGGGDGSVGCSGCRCRSGRGGCAGHSGRGGCDSERCHGGDRGGCGDRHGGGCGGGRGERGGGGGILGGRDVGDGDHVGVQPRPELEGLLQSQ